MQKAEIRSQNKQQRSKMSKAEVSEKSKVICKHLFDSDLYKSANTIMLYMPLGNEVDTSSIMEKAFADGKRAVLPVMDAEDIIVPCFADTNTKFQSGRYSIQEPTDAQIADPRDIDIVLVPGIAFDKYGNRIGFGKGCYDGFLNSTKAVKIGICYDFQVCNKISADPHDVKMDYIICEKGWI